jgi:drug/metabolite transporter (DMT)-like permease
MNRSALTANGAAAIAMVLFGASVVATRAVGDEVPPFTLGVLRFGQAGSLILVALAAAGRQPFRIQPGTATRLMLIGVVLYGIFALLFNVGLQLTSASQGALMLATFPLWTALISRLRGTERLARRQLAGLGCALAGIALVLGGQGFDAANGAEQLTGNLLMLGAAFTGAAGTVLTKRAVASQSPLVVTAYGMLGGASVLLPFALVELARANHLPAVTQDNIALVLFLGIIGGAIGYSLATYGLSRLDASAVAIYINLNPLTAVLLGALLLDERIGIEFLMGAAVVIAGLLLFNWPAARKAPQAPAPPLEQVVSANPPSRAL